MRRNGKTGQSHAAVAVVAGVREDGGAAAEQALGGPRVEMPHCNKRIALLRPVVKLIQPTEDRSGPHWIPRSPLSA
jgi:hypothetical protein